MPGTSTSRTNKRHSAQPFSQRVELVTNTAARRQERLSLICTCCKESRHGPGSSSEGKVRLELRVEKLVAGDGFGLELALLVP